MKTLTLLILLSVSVALNPQEEKLDVIVNSQNPVARLSISEVRMHWMRRPIKRWGATGNNIKPVDYKSTLPARNRFYKDILRLTESDVDAYFLARQYQSNEMPPELFNSDDEVIKYVSNEIGAIGFVPHKSIKEEDLRKIKIVLSL